MTRLSHRLCAVPGCTLDAHGHGRFCNGHSTAYRRHGAPTQKGVTASELRPYLQFVDQRIAKNRESPLWAALDARWRILHADAKALAESGKPQYRYQRESARAVLKLADSGVEPRDIVRTVLALYVMEGNEGRRFKDDRAFQFQMVRRVRLLSDVSVGSYHNQATGKTKRVYRDMAPRIVLCLAQWLATALGAAGVWMAKLERDQNEAKQQAHEDMRTALRGLQ